MSVQSEIIDLQNHLQSAKMAVNNAGGGIGNTGLAGLASEIASIPTGGEVEVGSFGKVAYYDKTFIIDNINAMGCKAEVVDIDKVIQWADSSYLFIRSEEGSWYINGGDGPYTISDIETLVGVLITDVEDDWAEIHIRGEIGPNFAGKRTECAIQTIEEFEEFYFNYNIDKREASLPNGETIDQNQITEFILGPDCLELGDYFLAQCHGLMIFDASLATEMTLIGNYVFEQAKSLFHITGLNSVLTIGNNFCTQNPSREQIELPKVETIGNHFCVSSQLHHFYGAKMPNLRIIGNNFLSGCTFLQVCFFSSIAQSTGGTPLPLEQIGTNAFVACNNLTSINMEGFSSTIHVGENFCNRCSSLGDITLSLFGLEYSTAFDGDNSFTTDTTATVAYVVGLRAYGEQTEIDAFKNRFPDRSSAYSYRKWRA